MTSEKIVLRLLDKQQTLIARINAIELDFKKGRSHDFAEQITERENDEVLDGIHHEAKIELQQINEALQSIKNKDYGFCIKCKDPIAPARLNALPYTSTCINCAH